MKNTSTHIIETHSFWSHEAISFVSPFQSLQEIVDECKESIGIDVSGHSTSIESIYQKPQKNILWPWVDGVISFSSQHQLLLRTADCAPVSFCSKDSMMFWLLHIGWKWLIWDIIWNFVNSLQENSASPKDILLWIWPMAGEWFEFWRPDFIEQVDPYFKKRSVICKVKKISDEKISFDFKKSILDTFKSYGFENIFYSQKNTLDITEWLPSWRKWDTSRITTLIYTN